jgi:ankyrin repeat protein
MLDNRLIDAIKNGNLAEVKNLIQRGVSFDIFDIFNFFIHCSRHSYTLIEWAAKNGYIEIFKLLLEKGANIHQQNHSWHTSLILAAENGHIKIVKLLLKRDNVCVNYTYWYGNTALMEAAAKGRIEIVKLLLEKGADVNKADYYGNTALMRAAANGRIEIVKLLLEKGADVNKADDGYGNTALILAAANGHKEIVKLLIEKGANVNHTNWDGYDGGNTALMKAAANGRIEIVKLLLEKGANIHQANKDGKTALMKAAANGRIEIVKLLLEKGADINQADNDGETALRRAIRSHKIQIFELLLEKGADINQADNDGETALIEAAAKGNIEIVELLLKRDDVNFHQVRKYGRHTALSLAIKYDYQFIVILLKKAIAQFIPTIKKKLDDTFNSLLNVDALSALIQKINTLTDRQKDDRYKNERKEIRAHLVALIEVENEKLSRGMITGDLEVYLNCLTYIQNNLNIIKPNPKEKTAGKKIKSLILKVQSKIDGDKQLVPDSIASKINSCLNPDTVKNDLKLKLSDLVKPSDEKEIDELKSMVVRLTIDQRKLLRETLKTFFDDAIKKPEENTWVKELQKNYDESKNTDKSIPFIAILRVSESGNKPDHDTKIWSSVINGIQWLQPSSKSKVSNAGLFSDKKRDETGQLSYPSLDKHKPGNNDL